MAISANLDKVRADARRAMQLVDNMLKPGTQMYARQIAGGFADRLAERHARAKELVQNKFRERLARAATGTDVPTEPGMEPMGERGASAEIRDMYGPAPKEEERPWTVARALLGYDIYDAPGALQTAKRGSLGRMIDPIVGAVTEPYDVVAGASSLAGKTVGGGLGAIADEPLTSTMEALPFVIGGGLATGRGVGALARAGRGQGMASSVTKGGYKAPHADSLPLPAKAKAVAPLVVPDQSAGLSDIGEVDNSVDIRSGLKRKPTDAAVTARSESQSPHDARVDARRLVSEADHIEQIAASIGETLGDLDADAAKSAKGRMRELNAYARRLQSEAAEIVDPGSAKKQGAKPFPLDLIDEVGPDDINKLAKKANLSKEDHEVAKRHARGGGDPVPLVKGPSKVDILRSAYELRLGGFKPDEPLAVDTAPVFASEANTANVGATLTDDGEIPLGAVYTKPGNDVPLGPRPASRLQSKAINAKRQADLGLSNADFKKIKSHLNSKQSAAGAEPVTNAQVLDYYEKLKAQRTPQPGQTARPGAETGQRPLVDPTVKPVAKLPTQGGGSVEVPSKVRLDGTEPVPQGPLIPRSPPGGYNVVDGPDRGGTLKRLFDAGRFESSATHPLNKIQQASQFPRQDVRAYKAKLLESVGEDQFDLQVPSQGAPVVGRSPGIDSMRSVYDQMIADPRYRAMSGDDVSFDEFVKDLATKRRIPLTSAQRRAIESGMSTSLPTKEIANIIANKYGEAVYVKPQLAVIDKNLESWAGTDKAKQLDRTNIMNRLRRRHGGGYDSADRLLGEVIHDSYDRLNATLPDGARKDLALAVLNAIEDRPVSKALSGSMEAAAWASVGGRPNLLVEGVLQNLELDANAIVSGATKYNQIKDRPDFKRALEIWQSDTYEDNAPGTLTLGKAHKTLRKGWFSPTLVSDGLSKKYSFASFYADEYDRLIAAGADPDIAEYQARFVADGKVREVADIIDDHNMPAAFENVSRALGKTPTRMSLQFGLAPVKKSQEKLSKLSGIASKDKGRRSEGLRVLRNMAIMQGLLYSIGLSGEFLFSSPVPDPSFSESPAYKIVANLVSGDGVSIGAIRDLNMQPSKEHAVTPYIPVPFERGGTAAEEMFKAIRNQVPGYITRRALTGYLAKKGYEGPRRIISKQTDQPDARRAANVLSLFKKDKK